jgi:hypothetical protein
MKTPSRTRSASAGERQPVHLDFVESARTSVVPAGSVHVSPAVVSDNVFTDNARSARLRQMSGNPQLALRRPDPRRDRFAVRACWPVTRVTSSDFTLRTCLVLVLNFASASRYSGHRCAGRR